MAELLDEIHPGEILLEDFMEPMGISARQLAADIDVSPSRISAGAWHAADYRRYGAAPGNVLLHGGAFLDQPSG